MKTKARVDLSKSWRFVLFAAYLSVLSGLIAKQIVAQENEQGSWRRTSRGWEYAHSVPMNSTTIAVSNSREMSESILETQSFHQYHRIALPLALFSFILSFSYWSLSEVPNRGIVRRLSQS